MRWTPCTQSVDQLITLSITFALLTHLMLLRKLGCVQVVLMFLHFWPSSED